jgi:hypothetical protein
MLALGILALLYLVLLVVSNARIGTFGEVLLLFLGALFAAVVGLLGWAVLTVLLRIEQRLADRS